MQIYSAIVVCSLALIGCFFLPWIDVFMGNSASGYQLQELPSDEVKLFWLIPCGALLALLAAAVKQGVGPMSQIAGALPFLALLYYSVKIGQELFQALQIGAYLTLILGAALFVLPRFLKKPQS
jgi:hypothetical protein